MNGTKGKGEDRYFHQSGLNTKSRSSVASRGLGPTPDEGITVLLKAKRGGERKKE